MRRTLQAIVAFAVVAMLLTGTASAVSSQGLEWAVVVGDHWNYDLTTTDEGVVDTEELYVVVNVTSTIPDIVTDLLDLPYANSTMTFANYTALDFSTAFLMVFLAFITPRFIFPVGNFTLLTELYNADDFYNGTVYDSGGYWGMDLNDYELLDRSTDMHADFLKTDGVLAHWTLTSSNMTTSEVVGSVSMVRQGLPGLDIIDWIREHFLIVGIGVGFIIIVGAVACMRRK